MQLLHTIRDTIGIRFERRGLNTEGNPNPENPPPENASLEPPDCMPPCRTFWQRLVSLFTVAYNNIRYVE